jgi:hypothetical protein
MINIVYGGSDAFDAVVYGESHPNNLQYFQNQVNSVSNTLTEIGQGFFSNTQKLYEDIHGSEAMRRLRAVVRTAKSLFAPNVVSSMLDIGVMQQAPYVMQRWIMAEPMVREMYQKQICEGYGNSYLDTNPGTIGDTHYDYQRVMHGVVRESEEFDFEVKFYMSENVEGDRDLTLSEKADIMTTWENVRSLMKRALEDPTSPSNNKL